MVIESIIKLDVSKKLCLNTMSILKNDSHQTFQSPKPIQLKHKATYKTGLCNWNRTGFCVMESTGDIVFVGKEKKDDPSALHIYKYKGEWHKVGTKSGPCIHEDDLYTLPVMIESNECLLVSCTDCRTIWFCDIDTGEFNEALRDEGFKLGLMCKGKGDYVYIENNVKGPADILKVKCSPTELIVDKCKISHHKMEAIYSLCYLKDVNCVAISSWQNHIVKAIHCETNEEVWEVKGKVEDVTWEPHGLFYSPEHQLLIVCDAIDDGRLVVLNPRDGSILQIMPLPNLGDPVSSSMHEENIILNNRVTFGFHINVFTITSAKPE